MSGFTFPFAKRFVSDAKVTEAESEFKLKARIGQIASKSNVLPSPTIIVARKEKNSHFVPINSETSITLKTGERRDARIINVSRYGVAIETEVLRVKDVILIGSTKVQFVRSVRSRAMFKFMRPLSFKLCNSQLIL
jgi:hypothetical protein